MNNPPFPLTRCNHGPYSKHGLFSLPLSGGHTTRASMALRETLSFRSDESQRETSRQDCSNVGDARGDVTTGKEFSLSSVQSENELEKQGRSINSNYSSARPKRIDASFVSGLQYSSREYVRRFFLHPSIWCKTLSSMQTN